MANLPLFLGGGVSFTSARDIPSLQGRVILVTGGNSGLGKQCVLEFARHGAEQIWLAARSLDKARLAVEDIKKEVPDATIRCLELDLASFESIAVVTGVWNIQRISS